jgi:hypothetical protein
MISLVMPAAWLLLIPVILIETGVGVRVLRLPFRRVLPATAVANCFSTLLGVPFAWLVLAFVELKWFGTAKGLNSVWTAIYAVTIQSPWLIPYEKELVWMIPTAAAVLTVPLWMMSAASEYWIAKRMLPEVPSALKWQWMWKANVASYILLLAVIAALPILNPLIGWAYAVLAPLTDFLVELVMKLG